MDKNFIAHRRVSDGKVQPVGDHLFAVADLSGQFASDFVVSGTDEFSGASLEAVGRLIGLLHDLGKYSKEFQLYIQSATELIDQDDEDYVNAELMKGKIDHSSAGAQLLWGELFSRTKAGPLVAQVLAICIASHHSGLIDCIAPDGTDIFSRRMRKDEQRAHMAEALRNSDSAVSNELRRLIDEADVAELLSAFVSQMVNREASNGTHRDVLQFKLGLLVRMLFSCVVDADRVDTADFEKPRGGKHRQIGQAVNWDTHLTRFENFMSLLSVDRPIDRIRRNVSDHCRAAADRDRGIFTLTVPTGGGKTLASLRFALHHARKHGLERIIYVIPFTSIIDQNADVVRSILEPSGSGVPAGSVVLEHHSNLTPEKLTWRSKILSENWDAPIIFTTSVQFLESFFGGGTRGARRAHQLAKSVVIFDEAQTVPIRCVYMFNHAINFLVEGCGSSVVLCTATQPLLNGVEEKHRARYSEADEIMPDTASLFRQLQRTRVIPDARGRIRTDAEISDLAESSVASSGSCLIIVNTRKAASSLYDIVDPGAGGKKFHLSTSMCPAHRRAKFAEIRKRLADGQHIVCVSTQLIEAGVDIDFGTVIRYIAGLDSIAQAAGRCNRNGLREEGTVYVVTPAENNVRSLEDIKVGQETSERIISDFQLDPESLGGDLLSPEAMTRYFEHYFYRRVKTMPYHVGPKAASRDDTILNLLAENKLAVNAHVLEQGSKPPILLRQAFMTAGKAFQSIDAATKGIIVPYGEEGNYVISGLCASFKPEAQFDLLKRAQQYSVNVYPNDFDSLLANGAINEIGEGTGVYYLNPTYYNDEFGLTLNPNSPMELKIG